MTLKKRKFDLIIFDWDGTLVDSIDWIVHSLQTAAEKHNYKAPDDQAVKNTIGLSIQQSIATLFPGIDPSNQQQLAVSYTQEFLSQDIDKKHLFAGVENMLSILNQNKYQLAIATGKTRGELDWAIDKTGVSSYFDITRCADETASKPQPVMLEQIINEMGVAKERALMIGDSIHDIQMANYAGIAAIAVSCGANSAAELQQHNPLLSLAQATELLKFL